MYQDIGIDDSKDCINMPTYDLIKYASATGVYGSMISKFISTDSPTIAELERECGDIITKKVKMTSQLKELIKRTIDEVLYLNYGTNNIATFLMKQNLSYEDSLSISQEIEKKTKLVAYKIFDKHKEDICSHIKDIQEVNSVEENRYKIENILKSITEKNLLSIYDGRNEHFLKMAYNKVHDNLKYIDRFYISNMGSHVIQLYEKLENVVHASTMSLCVVKIGPRYLNMFELKNEDDIRRAANFFYYKIPIMETDFVDVVRKHNTEQIEKNESDNLELYKDKIRNARLTILEIEDEIVEKRKAGEDISKLELEIKELEDDIKDFNRYLDDSFNILMNNSYDHSNEVTAHITLDQIKKEHNYSTRMAYFTDDSSGMSDYSRDIKREILKGFKRGCRTIFGRVGIIDLSYTNPKVKYTSGNLFLHATLLTIDTINKTVEYTDSNGDVTYTYDSKKIQDALKRLIDHLFIGDIDFKLGDIANNPLVDKLLANKSKIRLSLRKMNLYDKKQYGGDKLSKSLLTPELEKIYSDKGSRYSRLNSNIKKITNILNNDKQLKYLARIKVVNSNFYDFLEELKRLGKKKLDEICDNYLKDPNYKIDSKYSENLKLLIDDLYRFNIGNYKTIEKTKQLNFSGEGPQALTNDSYCLVWTIFESLLKATKPELTMEEISVLLSSRISDAYLGPKKYEIDSYKNKDFNKYLSLKYTPVSNTKILSRIEKFLLYTYAIINPISKLDADSKTINKIINVDYIIDTISNTEEIKKMYSVR